MEHKNDGKRENAGRAGKKFVDHPSFCVDYDNNIYFGNHCKVNMNCTFLNNNKLIFGDNVVIGAESVVKKDIPKDTIAYGNLYRIIRENK